MSYVFQLYDEEKVENDRLRKELEQTKRELREAKNELDRVMKKEAARASDTSEKRVSTTNEDGKLSCQIFGWFWNIE